MNNAEITDCKVSTICTASVIVVVRHKRIVENSAAYKVNKCARYVFGILESCGNKCSVNECVACFVFTCSVFNSLNASLVKVGILLCFEHRPSAVEMADMTVEVILLEVGRCPLLECARLVIEIRRNLSEKLLPLACICIFVNALHNVDEHFEGVVTSGNINRCISC